MPTAQLQRIRKGILIPIAAALLVSGFVAIGTEAPAGANPPAIPPIDYSFYVAPSDTYSTALQLGCNQANYDGSVHYPSTVILDFGAQTSDGSGTYLPSTSYYWTDGADEYYAANFAYGYQACNHGTYRLNLAIGTNNDGSVTNSYLGDVWAIVASAVRDNVSTSGYVNVSVWGAGDWEGGFGSFAHLSSWMNGGDGTGTGYAPSPSLPPLIFNYGSADGCPQNYGQYQNLPCTGDWNQGSNWLDSWGWVDAWATPEIYYNGCGGFAAQDLQWGMISLFGAVYYGRPIEFWGPMTETGTCEPSVNAYIDLYNVINNNPATAWDPGYLLQIHTA